MRSRKMLFGRKLNNKGMSLVEVIIAITILGLVAVPVLHSMTTAMVYNQKARIRQELTLTAESIMETFKGYDLTTLFVKFGGSSDASKNGDGGQGGTGIEGVEYEMIDTDSGYRYEPDTTTPRKYIFYIDDMKADNGDLYDVTITATPNSIENVVEPTQLEPTRDAVFMGDRKDDTEAHDKAVEHFLTNYKTDLVNAFSSDAGSGGAFADIGGEKKEITETLVENEMSITSYIKLDEKRLTFDIKEDGGNYVVIAKLEYTYHFEKYPYYVKKVGTSVPDEYESEASSADGGAPTPTPDEWESKELAFYNGKNACIYKVATLPNANADGDAEIYKNPVEAKLGRLFIYYYPNYSLDAEADKIFINNNTAITKFQCFILKQRTEALSNNSLMTKENGYKAWVKIDNPAGGSCEAFHNFRDNIGGGSSTTAPSIAGAIADYSYDTPEFTTRFEEQEVLSYKLALEVKQGTRTITKIESTMSEKIKKSEE